MAGDDEDFSLDDIGDDNAQGNEAEGGDGEEQQADLSAEQPSEEGADNESEERPGQGQGQARRVSRETQRVQALAHRTKAAEDRAIRAEQAIEQLQRQLGNTGAAEKERQHQALRAAMTPEELIRDDMRIAGEKHDQQLRNMQMQLMDREDRSEFNATIKEGGKRFTKFVPEVERSIGLLRQQGNYGITRMNILDYLIGKAVREKNVDTKPVRQAAARVASQTVRPGNNRADIAPNSRELSERAAREKRLLNVEL